MKRYKRETWIDRQFTVRTESRWDILFIVLLNDSKITNRISKDRIKVGHIVYCSA